MLLYDPPFLTVEEVTIFRDASDVETFYYAIGVPELVTSADDPHFWATAILPDAAVGSGDPGMVTRTTVSFDIELRLGEERREQVLEEIKSRWGRKAKSLLPVPLSGGRARLILATTVNPEEDASLFVHEGHASSLVGNNRAAFAVAAENREAKLLVASITADHLAAVVCYDLEYPGLAPSFEAHMTVHWQAVYSKFREHQSTNFIFVSNEVENVIETLEEARAIEIEILELDPESKTEATKALFNQLRQEVVEKLFETPRQIGEVPVEDRIRRGVRDTLASLLPGKHHALRTIDQQFLSETTIDLREQRVRTYHYYPQSTLTGVVNRAGGVQDRLKFVDMGQLPHLTEEIRIELTPGAAELGVQLAEVQVRVGTEAEPGSIEDKTFLLQPDSNQLKTLHYRSLGVDELITQFQLTLHLHRDRVLDEREKVILDWQPVEGGRIFIDPERYLDVVELQVYIDDPSLLTLPAIVQVEIEVLTDSDAVSSLTKRLSFTSEILTHRFKVVVAEGVVPRFRLREIILPQGEPDFLRLIEPIQAGTHRIKNPFGHNLTSEVFASANWEVTELLSVEFRVWDVERELFVEDKHTFNKDTPRYLPSFLTSRITPHRPEARVTQLKKTGVLVKGPWTDLVVPLGSISDNVEAKRRVRIVLIAPHFETLKVRRVFVELRTDSLETQLKFDRDGAVRDWVYPFPDPTQERFEYRLRAISEEGLRFSEPWTETRLDFLRLRLPEDPWDQ